MDGLKTWLRKALLPGSFKSKHPDGPPLTPLDRRPLTPLPDSASTSPFFAVLPPDVRAEILALAFGRLRLHIDLALRAAFLPAPHRHCGRRPNRDGRGPKAWRWTGGVCHRLQPEGSYAWSPQSQLAFPSYWDSCVDGDAECFGRPCFLGIMGWLLSCRQAYAEGVDILWRTNELLLTGDALVQNLPRVLLPQRLAAVTRLELTWQLELADSCPPSSTHTPRLDEDNVAALFTALTSLPALRRVFLTLGSGGGKWTYCPSELEDLDCDAVLLAPFDRFLEARPRLHTLTVSLPRSIFTTLSSRCWLEMERKTPFVRPRLLVDDQSLVFPDRVWRFTDSGKGEDRGGDEEEGEVREAGGDDDGDGDGDAKLARLDLRATWPNPPFEYEGNEPVKGRGFWIVEGQIDWLDMACCH
ncbi:hypothetical protein ACHAQA_000111 [Verticillium albo-atrum]